VIRKLLTIHAIILILLCTACSSQEQQYQFPIKTEEMEKVLAEQELDWFIKEVGVVDDSQNIITLTNDDKIIFGIGSKVDEGRNVLNMTWFLPTELTEDKFNQFYNDELSHLFELVGIFYGNSREINKGLDEFLKYYYTNEDNYDKGVYWTKRINDDHLKIEIKPWQNSPDNRNRLGTLIIMPGKSYEYYLKLLNKGWKNAAEIDSIEISESTVEEILEFDPPVDEELYSKHFIISGHLEDINEIKNVPESLQNTETKFIKPNKDKYLNAKLIDDTGSMDVFLQTTSLNKNELGVEREHNVILFYYENNPILIVRNSVLAE